MLEGPSDLHLCDEDSALQRAQSEVSAGMSDPIPKCKSLGDDPDMSSDPRGLIAKQDSSRQVIPRRRSALLEARGHHASRMIPLRLLQKVHQHPKDPSSRSGLKDLFVPTFYQRCVPMRLSKPFFLLPGCLLVGLV